MLNGSSSRLPIPRFASPATERPSAGPGVAAVAEQLGLPLMPWQRMVADIALEHDGGQFAYRDVSVSTPRQSGKSTLILAVIVARMLAAPSQTVVYGAQTRLAARTKLFDRWWPRLRRSALGGMFTLSRATGAEALRAANGSTCHPLSTDEGASHGETLDLAVLDECWRLDAAAEQAIKPAMATRPNGQAWCLSTAGTEKSSFCRRTPAAPARSSASPRGPRSLSGAPLITSTSAIPRPGRRLCRRSGSRFNRRRWPRTWRRCRCRNGAAHTPISGPTLLWRAGGSSTGTRG